MSTPSSLTINSDERVRSVFTTPPHFDHVFVTVDAATLRSINECSFLSDESFGRFLIRESESTLLGKYTPTRVFGENTLIEMFLDQFGGEEFKSVTVGVVLSFDHAGEALAARQRLEEHGVEYVGETIKRKMPGQEEPVPWYLSTRPKMGQGSALTLFLSEMNPDFLRRIGARFGENGRQDRSAHLEAALRRPHGPKHLMQDIIGVTLRLRPEGVKRTVAILTALGYERRDAGDAVHLRGPDSELTLLADSAAIEGLLALKIRLRKPDEQPGRRFDFGTASSLVLSPEGPTDCHAVWSFVPQKAAR